MPEAFVLSDADRRLLQQTLDRARKQVELTSYPTRERVLDGASPDIHFAYTSTGGIPSRVGSTLGQAQDVAVYQVIESTSTLEEVVGVAVQTVYNTSPLAIAAGEWIGVAKDKFGSWFALQPGTIPPDEGTGTGTNLGPTPPAGGICSLAGLEATDQVLATGESQQLLLDWDGSGWATTGTGILDTFDYPGGSGPLRFWYESGVLHLSLDGKELLSRGDGCFCGGPLTGHSVSVAMTGTGTTTSTTGTGTVTGTGTMGGTTPCSGTSFTICITCAGGAETDTGTGTAASQGIVDIALGSGSNCTAGASSLTIPNITVGAGSRIIVNVGVASTDAILPGVTFAGNLLTQNEEFHAGSPTKLGVSVWSGVLVSSTTGDVVITVPGGSGVLALLANVVEVTNVNGLVGAATTGSGTGSQPQAGGFVYLPGDYYFQGVFLMATPGGSYTWGSPMSSGGQDVATCSPYVLTEGFLVLDTTTSGTLTSQLDGVTPAAWVGVLQLFNEG